MGLSFPQKLGFRASYFKPRAPPVEWNGRIRRKNSKAGLLQKTTVASTDIQMALLDHGPYFPQPPTRYKRILRHKKHSKVSWLKNRRRRQNITNRTPKDLRKLKIGAVVRMKPTRLGQHEWKKALVTSCYDDRLYIVETEDGGQYRLNRVHLWKLKNHSAQTMAQRMTQERMTKPTPTKKRTIQSPNLHLYSKY